MMLCCAAGGFHQGALLLMTFLTGAVLPADLCSTPHHRDAHRILHETQNDVLVKTVILPPPTGLGGLTGGADTPQPATPPTSFLEEPTPKSVLGTPLIGTPTQRWRASAAAADDTVPMPMPKPKPMPKRRQNDRILLHRDNIPSVYTRLLSALAMRRRADNINGNALEQEQLQKLEQEEQLSAMRHRIAKFLNLFTVVQFPNEACEGLLAGTCFHHLQCRSLGGKPTKSCAQGYGVCCVIEKTCGETTQLNSTYFVNPPSEPKPASHSARSDGYFNCFLTIVKIDEGITQLRLDFDSFELAAPTNGSCAEERFVVINPDRNAPVPALCGGNTGQHMYVQVSTAPGRVRLGVQWLGGPAGGGVPLAGPPRRWAVRVTQLRAQDPRAAPPGCLQLHSGHSGQLRSFGSQGHRPGYTNNLNYAICVRKEMGFCSITYSAQSGLDGSDLPFQLLNADQEGSPTIPPGQAGAEIFNCPDDYIVVNGLRLCGERLNDASVDPDYTHNAPVTDSGSGPFVLPVRTNGNLTGRGFDLSYWQNPCSEAKEAQSHLLSVL